MNRDTEPALSLSLSVFLFNAHIKPHIDYASVVWDGCSDVLKKRLNSLHRRAVKLILPDTTLTTDQKFKGDENNEPTKTT